MKSKPKEVFKFINIGMYDLGLIVACLDNSKDIHKRLNLKSNKEASDFLNRNIDEFPTPFENDGGCIIINPETNKPLILYMKNKERTWEFWDTLIHEVHHIVYKTAQYVGFEKEIEHQAYLMETVFRQIRRLLNK